MFKLNLANVVVMCFCGSPFIYPTMVDVHPLNIIMYFLSKLYLDEKLITLFSI